MIEVDHLSRIRSPSGKWDFYTAEDIEGGRIVFSGVESVRFEPSGPVANDLINEISAKPVGDESGRWTFAASITSVKADGTSTEVTIHIVGSDAHIEDPTRSGHKIRD